MREIKFRAWFVEDKKMAYWDDVQFMTMSKVLDDPHNVIPMQSTGLKDSNGVEIYVGDIVTFDIFDIEKIGWVIFDDGEFKITYTPSKQTLPFYIKIHSSKKVIGNIYENPELIDD